MVRLIPRIIFDKGDSLRRHFIESRRIFFIDPVPLARLDDDQDDVLSLQRTRIEIGVAIGFAAHLPFRKIIVESGKPLSQRGVVGRLSEKLVQDIGNIYEVKSERPEFLQGL